MISPLFGGEGNTRNIYRLPFKRRPVKICQGFNGPYSHIAYKRNGQVYDSRYAIDFELPFGTEITAAMGGKAKAIMTHRSEESYTGTDIETGLMACPNFIIIEDNRGLLNIYSHLSSEPSLIRCGDRVFQNQPISKSGNSGWIGPTPHLHFAVFRYNNRGWETIPIRFEDYFGELEHEFLGEELVCF